MRSTHSQTHQIYWCVCVQHTPKHAKYIGACAFDTLSNTPNRLVYVRSTHSQTHQIYWCVHSTHSQTRQIYWCVRSTHSQTHQIYCFCIFAIISKNINFTSKTNFSTEKILEMPFYSGKDGFYQEKQKFYLENEVFYRKNFRNGVLQWKSWCLLVKI